jgi:hypothetical protein
MDQEEYVKLMEKLHVVFTGRRVVPTVDEIAKMAEKVSMDPWDYVMTASERYHRSNSHSSEIKKPEEKRKFVPPKEVPDISELELYEWAAWMDLENWDFVGCYHPPAYTKEAFTGISRTTKQPVKNAFNKETWVEVGETTTARAAMATSAVEVFIKYLKKKYARSSV